MPEQYPDPFPSFAAATDTEDWGRRDALAWIQECRPSRDEIEAVYAAYVDEDQGYDYGVEETLYVHGPL